MPHPLSSKLRNHQRISRLSREKIEAILNEHPLTAAYAPTDSLKLEYDLTVDAAYLRLARGRAIESKRIRGGLIVDFDINGQIIGVEIMHAARRFGAAQSTRAMKKTA